MWTTLTQELDDHTIRVEINQGASPLTYSEALRLWQEDPAFRTFFIKLLADCPYSAFRWETPPVTTATIERPFEFVVLDSPELAVDPDTGAFAEHFKSVAPEEIVAFPNLGKDAMMVVPCPDSLMSAYAHLGAFSRQAPESQQHALWKQVGASMQQRLGAKPVWLSTAGGGVACLHVRLDDRPKYYGYAPYREAD